MDMEKAGEAVQKITSAYAEDKYTDKYGFVWLGIEGDTRDEDCWLREDALESMSSADMMKKMIYELMHWDETPVFEDPYEYNIETLDLVTGHTHLWRQLWEPNTEWLQRKLDERKAYDRKLLNAPNGGPLEYENKLVKRRKPGRVEDV
jgi:hypothetical protein